ncbi:MAG: hypothetical protein LBE76_03050 [Nitrososphaerota archaeon]|jgi:hypothetical protein|nr:hypothetical protein [Nitrososphaerota archaeon]
MLNRKNRKVVCLITCLFILGIIIPTQISLVHSSIGSIRINKTTVSDVNQQVHAGDDVNLYFGDSSIKWAGTSFYLLLSRDLSATVSPGDYVYSPMFSVAMLKDSTLTHSYSNSEGSWVIGNNWINGTFARNMAAGRYSVKVFDFGVAGSEVDTNNVAVTDTYINVLTSPSNQFTFNLSPHNGTGGIPVTFSGSGYLPNTALVITYYDPVYLTYKAWKDIVTDSSGSFSFTEIMPDLGKSNQQGDNSGAVNHVQFSVTYQGVPYSFATYTQYARGIKSVGNQIASGLYGNGTSLVSTVNFKAGDTFTITGKWFHPGVIYVLLDSQATVGTVTHNQWRSAIKLVSTTTDQSGNFTATVTLPTTIDGGEHYIAIEDSTGNFFIIKILVTTGTFQISPASGPGGAKIQYTGSGYPPFSNVDIEYQDRLYSSWNYWITVRADANGNINLNEKIPDLKKTNYAGDYGSVYSQISFRTKVNNTDYAYAEYTQYARGLKQVGSKIASTLYGNSTNFESYNLKVTPGETITISGRYFHPGDVIYIRWDGVAVVNTVTPNQWTTAEIIGTSIVDAQGSFTTTVKIPTASNGLHWVSIEDSQTNFIIKLPLASTTTPSPTPTSGSNSSKPSPSPSLSPSKLTPVIGLHCKSLPLNGGFRVDISGTCTSNNEALANKTVQLYVSKDGSRTWEPLTLVNTDNAGKFSAVWVSQTSGIFLIKAECAADVTYNSSVATVTVAIEPAKEGSKENTVFTMTSNSTISQLSFNSETSELGFTASGTTGTTGYVSVNIPQTLIKDISNLKVYLDGNEITFSSSQESDAWIITITYTHSTHTIIMNLTSDAQNQNTDSSIVWIVVAFVLISSVITVVAIVAMKKNQYATTN